MKIESEREEDHRRDDDAHHDRVRATKSRVRDLERRGDRREDRDLRDPVERVSAIDDERVDDSATKEPGRGTGLGLYLARHVVEREGGEMRVVSAEGRGTEVTLTVPEAGA